jgi:hypothetical protein
MTWIDNTQLMKSVSPDRSFRSLLDFDTLIFGRPFHQNVKTDLTKIKMERHEQRCVMKFSFLQGKKSKARHRLLIGVLGEAVLSLSRVKRWRWRFKEGNLSLDDESRPGRPLSDIGETVSQFLKKKENVSFGTWPREEACHNRAQN